MADHKKMRDEIGKKIRKNRKGGMSFMEARKAAIKESKSDKKK